MCFSFQKWHGQLVYNKLSKLIPYSQQVKLKTTSSRIGLYFQEELLPLTDELVSAVCRESQDFGFIVLETGENKVRLG